MNDTATAANEIMERAIMASGIFEMLDQKKTDRIVEKVFNAGFNSAIKLCIDLNYLGGLGHTVSIYANNNARIRQFSMLMNAGRIVVNTPSAQGAVGGIYNCLNTSFTLGCGTWGKNITTENVTTRHLLNIKRICRRRTNEKWLNFVKEKYLDEGESADDIIRSYHRNY